MGRSLKDKVRQAFLEDWDPIGIQDVPECQDEYDRYIKVVVQLIQAGKSEQKLFEYLWDLETAHMGLRGSQKETRAFAEELYKLNLKV